MANKFFGTDGIRAVANTYPMTADFVLKLAQSCAELICTNKKVVAIGKDTRISGSMIESALCAGFNSAGINVIKLGIIPTPALSAITAFLDVDMSIMITASHNPYSDNGIKLINSEGNKFTDVQTAMVEEKILEDNFTADPDKIGTSYDDKDAISHYISLVKSICSTAQPLKGLKVVLDAANGSFYDILPQVYKHLGAGVITLSAEPDGYNINKDCGSQHTQNLKDTVIQSNAHIGIASDGDGDRIFICDELGNKIATEQVIAFVANYMQDKKLLNTKAIISTILANTGLERFAKDNGFEYFSTDVGERYVIDKMQEIGANIGGEESGHLVVSNYSKTGDMLVVSILFCMALIEQNKKLSEIFPIFEMDFCQTINIRFENREKLSEALNNQLITSKANDAKVLLEGTGKIILRASGTEPLIRIWACGSDKTLIEKLCNDLYTLIIELQ